MANELFMRPHLAMGVRVGAAHHLALVFKYLYPFVHLTKFCNLIGPFVNDPPYLGELHEGEGHIGARMEAHDTTEGSGRVPAMGHIL